MLNQKAVRLYVQANHREKENVRISQEFYQHLEARLRLSINLAVELPSNKKTVRDLATGGRR